MVPDGFHLGQRNHKHAIRDLVRGQLGTSMPTDKLEPFSVASSVCIVLRNKTDVSRPYGNGK